MNDYTVQEINATTGEVIVRPATDAEVEVIEGDKVQAQKDKADALKKEANKEAAQAKLAALGLTADDLKALGL
jgi:hypothetical protein